MDTINPVPNEGADPPRPEAEMIAEAGLYVDAADVNAWVDSIGTDHELPPPPARSR
jgi:hypothetical protein